MGISQDEMVKSALTGLIQALSSGDKESAVGMMEGVTNLFINMVAMFFFMEVQDHQENPCGEGDNCKFYEVLLKSLRAMLPTMEKDIDRALQINLRLGNVKFPGYTPLSALPDKEFAEIADDPTNYFVVARKAARAAPGIDEIKQKLKEMGAVPISLQDLLKLMKDANGMPVDKTKLN